MTPRQAAISDFLAAAGWGDAAIEPLAGDASNRRYLRLARAGATAVLMDAPPERGEDVRPFIAVTEWLRARGLSAPRPLATEIDAGLLLLEDLGDDLFARHIARHPSAETTLYAAAVDLLAALSAAPPPERIGTATDAGRAAMDLAPYDRSVLDREAALFTGWWLPAVSAVSPGMTTDYAGLVAEATAPVASSREVLVLRDYHAENLIWLPGRVGDSRVGLLDYQDALAGHPAYDLVSLLEDARRDTTAELRTAMVGRYLAARPGTDPDGFRAAYAILGAQRNLKIIGIFARLARRDGKPRYLGLIPRVWQHLQRDLAHPSLVPLAAWLARHAPAPEPDVLARAGATVPA